MDLKRFKDMWGFKGWSATDCSLEGLSAFFYHDMIFSGPMGGATRILPAVAEAESFLAVAKFAETKKLPACETHPIYKLFPDFVEQLKGLV
jgi:tetrahydromethanopterin S-methyltransferase subunit H